MPQIPLIFLMKILLNSIIIPSSKADNFAATVKIITNFFTKLRNSFKILTTEIKLSSCFEKNQENIFWNGNFYSDIYLFERNTNSSKMKHKSLEAKVIASEHMNRKLVTLDKWIYFPWRKCLSAFLCYYNLRCYFYLLELSLE